MMYGWHFAALGRAGCTLPPRPCFEPGELAAPVARFSVVPAGRGGGDSATGAGSGGLATEATGAAVTTTGCGSGGGGERSMREAAGASLIADANALRQLPRFVPAKRRIVDLGRNPGHEAARRGNLLLHHQPEDRRRVVPFEEALARQNFPEHDRRRVDVRASVDRAPAELLGRHVTELALELS